MIVLFGLIWFYGISTIVGYLMSNPLYTYILSTYDLVWFDFMAYQLLFNAESSSYVYIKYHLKYHLKKVYLGSIFSWQTKNK